ncbi:MAG: hypothetical protein IIC72_10785 [Acidobacteria bacterium]|nr:hypothetical protein [Acidobacteriota bacterium]
MLELAPEDFDEQYKLHVERDRLRKMTRQYAEDRDANRSSEDLSAELEARKSALDAIRKRMISSAAQAGGGTGAFEGPGDGLKINRAMISATGADKLMQRIARLETILKERGEI